jgi:hypothetical protein
MSEFTEKQRLRFRRLLEVAHSTSFQGEREAALGAATRLAESAGLTLREAAGMAEADEPHHHRKPAPGARPEAAAPPWPEARHAHRRFHEAFRAHGKPEAPHMRRFASDLDAMTADKKRFEQAMQDALARGLDAEERRRRARLAAIEAAARRRSSRRWRPRAEFVRILLTETRMTMREIAATAGVTIYDVIREKLLLRAAT